jgi:hypothetical protein
MTKRRRKRTAAALAPVAASIVGLGLGAKPAAAATVGDSEFFRVPGTSYSCLIFFENVWPFDGHDTVARARTEIAGGKGTGAEACFSAQVSVSGTWLDPDGQSDGSGFNSDEDFTVERLYAPVGSDLTTSHRAFFPACGCFSPTFTLQGNSK